MWTKTKLFVYLLVIKLLKTRINIIFPKKTISLWYLTLWMWVAFATDAVYFFFTETRLVKVLTNVIHCKIYDFSHFFQYILVLFPTGDNIFFWWHWIFCKTNSFTKIHSVLYVKVIFFVSYKSLNLAMKPEIFSSNLFSEWF